MNRPRCSGIQAVRVRMGLAAAHKSSNRLEHGLLHPHRKVGSRGIHVSQCAAAQAVKLRVHRGSCRPAPRFVKHKPNVAKDATAAVTRLQTIT